MTAALRLLLPKQAYQWILMGVIPGLLVLTDTQVQGYGGVMASVFLGFALGIALQEIKAYPASFLVPELLPQLALVSTVIVLLFSVLANIILALSGHFILAEWPLIVVAGLLSLLAASGQYNASLLLVPIILATSQPTFLSPFLQRTVSLPALLIFAGTIAVIFCQTFPYSAVNRIRFDGRLPANLLFHPKTNVQILGMNERLGMLLGETRRGRALFVGVLALWGPVFAALLWLLNHQSTTFLEAMLLFSLVLSVVLMPLLRIPYRMQFVDRIWWLGVADRRTTVMANLLGRIAADLALIFLVQILFYGVMAWAFDSSWIRFLATGLWACLLVVVLIFLQASVVHAYGVHADGTYQKTVQSVFAVFGVIACFLLAILGDVLASPLGLMIGLSIGACVVIACLHTQTRRRLLNLLPRVG